ncbi:MAG: hypothetical protein KatS3mg124_1478 [Porticoccaceae bacterium]|nr:MAG: hypothetical protein KatS3mg124_1478 [Porticoccaceae bacterium]
MIARLVELGLVDFLDLDVATEPQQYHLGMPPVFVPVMSVLGRITSAAEAEGALAEGVCDLVGAARGLIAEPDLVGNAREGKEEEAAPASPATGAWRGCTTAPPAAPSTR